VQTFIIQHPAKPFASRRENIKGRKGRIVNSTSGAEVAHRVSITKCQILLFIGLMGL
jgi:hypothetical protein